MKYFERRFKLFDLKRKKKQKTIKSSLSMYKASQFVISLYIYICFILSEKSIYEIAELTTHPNISHGAKNNVEALLWR